MLVKIKSGQMSTPAILLRGKCPPTPFLMVGQMSGRAFVHIPVLINRFVLSLPRNIVVRLTDHLDMIIVVDWDVKQHSNKQAIFFIDSHFLLL